MSDYQQTRARHVQYLFGRLGEHLERLDWSAERLHEHRTERLRALVRAARSGSQWHRARLGDLDPETLEVDTLRDLPVMGKEDLMEHFDQIVTDPRVTLAAANQHIASLSSDRYFLGDLHAVASGGTSGIRGVFVWGWEAWATIQLTAMRQQLKDRLADPELASTPPVTMVVTANNATHSTTALAETFATEAVQMHRFPIGMPIERIVAGLNGIAGDGLATYPSMLARLLAEARAGRLRISPRRILTMAEPLLPEIRSEAEARWRAPVANMWGTSEAGINALGCFRGPGMHIPEDLLILEPVDEGGGPVPAGVTSAKVLVTNLFNPLQPLIRYEITDEVTLLDGPCACGSAHRRVADIQGRLDDTFTYRDGVSIHPHVFRSALQREASITEYQVRQTPSGAEILIRATQPVDTDRLERRLREELATLGLEEPLIATRLVDELTRLETGKLRRFIPLAGGPA